MIQRKQSLFLLVAVICYAICLFLPVASVEAKTMGGNVAVHCLGTVSGDNGILFDSTCLPLFALCAVSALVALVTIFMYNNRKLQMNLCKICMLFTGLWYVDYVLMFLGVVGLEKVEGTFQLGFGACLPLVSLILTYMALRGVESDEKLIKAADRIR